MSRHDAPAGLELCKHHIRDQIEATGQQTKWTDLDLQSLTVSDNDIAEFLTIHDDYEWPDSWNLERRQVFLCCCISEFQLVQYLKWINGGCIGTLNCMDVYCNAIAGIERRV